MLRLGPKEEKFFDMFADAAKIGHEAAKQLKDFMGNLNNAEAKYKAIKDMEHKGDQKSHEILDQLNKTFITPVDREDIYMIATEIDNVVDFIEQTASRFVMYNIDVAPKDALAVADMIVACTQEMVNLMDELKNMKKANKLSERIIEINRIEEQGDATFRKAITEMFRKEGIAPLEVIKWKDIYENLENVLDACEDVANIVEGVVTKHV